MTTKILNGGYNAVYTLTAPVTTLSITASGYLAAGLASTGLNTYTIVNNGGVLGAGYGISLAGGGVVTNAGRITSSSTTAGAGVVLGAGGTVTNAAGASITGYYGLVVAGQAGTVNNQGLILGGGKYGIKLAVGGVVTNGGAADTTATIRGNVALWAGVSATLHNFGTVAGTGTAGVGGYLKAGGLVTNGSAADTTAIIEGAQLGVAATGASGTVINYGTIEGIGTASAAIALEAGGVVTNGSVTDTTARAEGNVLGVAILGLAGTLNNFGTIIGGYGGGTSASGAYLKNGGAVNNGSAKDTTAHIGGSLAVAILGGVGTVNNFGTLGGVGAEIGALVGFGGVIINGSATDTTALVQAYIGLAATTNAATVTNFGTIEAGGGPSSISAQEAGVLLLAGGSMTNGSTTDTKALIEGGTFGVDGETISTTVSNFGTLSGTVAGVILQNGGKVTNGSLADTAATISGALAGVAITGAGGTVANFGTILAGPVHYFGVDLAAGGVVTNGAATDHAALIHAFIGVTAAAGGKITNNGTISGDGLIGSYGVSMGGGALLTNNAGAVISGQNGVAAATSAIVSNFGTIIAGGGYSVVLGDATARLNAEAGSLFVGTIAAGAGLVDVVSGVATASAITSHGKIEGAGTLLLSGGTSYFVPGASLLVSEIELSGAATVARIEGKVSDARIWDQAAGTLLVDSADQFVLTGAANTFTGTVTGLGTFELVGGADAFTDLTLSAAKMIVSKSAVTLAGTINLTKSLTVTTPNLIIAAAGASLTGGGSIQLSNLATNSIHGATAGATLTNGDLIRGAGKVGGGVMTLINTAAGKIESAGTLALTVDTGAATIANAGLIEALSGGGLVVQSAVSNTGTLATINGTLTVNGAVSGAGGVSITGGVASFTAAFGETVTFNTTGRLVLAHSQAYGGTIAGFSHTGASSLDLTDIAFSGATKATYVGNTTAGILTVTDGTHTANIHFTGDYHLATWTLTAAVGGGTHVVDPTHPKPPALPLVSAMAGFAPAPAGAAPSALPAWMTGPPVLTSAGHAG